MNKRIVIFASGSGSNAENIIKYFADKPVSIEKIFTNNPQAYVIERAKKLNTDYIVFDREQYKNGFVLNLLKEINPDLIVLAGFLWLIPQDFVEQFEHKIINIHPALLPKFGGKGMYGEHVHKSVIEHNEKESGITIHYVNKNYDEGAVICQHKCLVQPEDDYISLSKKIHELETKYFPSEIAKLLSVS